MVLDVLPVAPVAWPVLGWGVPGLGFGAESNFPMGIVGMGGPPRFTHWAQSSGSRENRSYERPRLSIQASSSWTVEGAKSDRGKM